MPARSCLAHVSSFVLTPKVSLLHPLFLISFVCHSGLSGENRDMPDRIRIILGFDVAAEADNIIWDASQIISVLAPRPFSVKEQSGVRWILHHFKT